jgi:ParB family chromosome partitioning protein
MTKTKTDETETTETTETPKKGKKGAAAAAPETPKKGKAKGEAASADAVNLAFAEGGAGELKMMDVRELVLAPFDSRAVAAEPTQDLLLSVEKNGVHTSLLCARVPEMPDGTKNAIMVIAGRSRRLAALKTKKFMVPVHIKPMSYQQAVLLAYDENESRQGLSAWDRAHAFAEILKTGLTQADIARERGISDATVSNHLTILKLPASIQALVRTGKLDITRVRELYRVADSDLQEQIAELATADKNNLWTAKDIREYIENVKAKEAAKAAKAKEKDAGGSDAPKVRGEVRPLVSAETAKAVKVLPKATAIAFAESIHASVPAARAKVAELPEDAPIEARLKAERALGKAMGAEETALKYLGLKELPKSLTAAENKAAE